MSSERTAADRTPRGQPVELLPGASERFASRGSDDSDAAGIEAVDGTLFALSGGPQNALGGKMLECDACALR